MTYAKLLKRFDPRSRVPFAWPGRLMRPGSTIAESDLWPDEDFPSAPLLLEFAGADRPARGWNRHKSDQTVILWRYDRDSGAWGELGRVSAPGAMWTAGIEPLVREALSEEYLDQVAPDLAAIRERIAAAISAELDVLSDERSRASVLTLVHDELACRISELLGSGEFGRGVGRSVISLSTTDRPTDPLSEAIGTL